MQRTPWLQSELPLTSSKNKSGGKYKDDQRIRDRVRPKKNIVDSRLQEKACFDK